MSDEPCWLSLRYYELDDFQANSAFMADNIQSVIDNFNNAATVFTDNAAWWLP